MKFKKLFVVFLFCKTLIFCESAVYATDSIPETKILIETAQGNIKIKLYNQTPLHRDNFIKLVKGHYFDSLLFHRVIQNFMIQGGDPDSKNAPAKVELGNGGPGYTIPAEFNKQLFHKKGVLAAARDSDLENPSQASAGSQFYIVQGKVFNDSLLQVQAKRITRLKLYNRIVNKKENVHLIEKHKAFIEKKQTDSTKYINDIINKQVDATLANEPLHTFSNEQIQAYKTIGGTPHLDGSYTIFGEVIEGLEVVDAIAKQKTDKNDRPINDVRMKISIIE
jgi:peptidylprolyl isomerase